MSQKRLSPSQPSQLYQAFMWWEKGWPPLCPRQKLTTAFAHVLIVLSWPGWASQSVSVEKRWPEEGDKAAPAWWVTLLAKPAFCFSFLFLFPEASSGRWVSLLPGGKHCLKISFVTSLSRRLDSAIALFEIPTFFEAVHETFIINNINENWFGRISELVLKKKIGRLSRSNRTSISRAYSVKNHNDE